MNSKYIKPPAKEKTCIASVRITQAQKERITHLNFNLSAFIRDKLDEELGGTQPPPIAAIPMPPVAYEIPAYNYSQIKQVMLTLNKLEQRLVKAQSYFGIELIYNTYTLIDYLEVKKVNVAALYNGDLDLDQRAMELFTFLTDRRLDPEKIKEGFAAMQAQERLI